LLEVLSCLGEMEQGHRGGAVQEQEEAWVGEEEDREG